MSIKFDTVEIQDATHLPRFIQHEDVADRTLTSLPLAREDGEVVIAEAYGKKVIRLQGTLIGTSQTDLDSNIDTFKELFSRPEKNLDIDWNGGTRRYVATCTKHTFTRDHYNTSAVPWVAEFTAFTGEGADTSATTALTAHAVTTTTPATDSFTMNGSKPAKPYITIQGNNFPANCAGIEYKDTDTGEKIVWAKSSNVNSTDYLFIDCANKKVYYSTDGVTLVEQTFYGVFPRFKVGTNNVQISCGDIVNQSSSETAAATGSGANILGTGYKNTQSFSVPYTDASFRAIRVALSKTGTPTGDPVFRIETDNNGSPSGTLVNANATWSIARAGISGIATYYTVEATGGAFTLQANTKYWLTLNAPGVDGSNYFSWNDAAGIYPKGIIKRSTDSGTTYASDLAGSQFAFQILFGGSGGTSAIKHSVTYTAAYL